MQLHQRMAGELLHAGLHGAKFSLQVHAAQRNPDKTRLWHLTGPVRAFSDLPGLEVKNPRRLRGLHGGRARLSL